MLGRWNIQYDEVIIKRKVEQANEDHCGCCNELILNNNITNTKNKENNYEKYDENYYKPFIL